MSFEQRLDFWLDLIIRRRALLIRVAAVTFGLVAIGSFLWPPLYQSSAKILVQSNRAQLLVSPGLQNNASNQPTVMTSPVSEQDLNSETELLTSRYVIERTVDRMRGSPEHTGLLHNAIAGARSLLTLPEEGYDKLHGLAQPTSEEKRALELSKKLSVGVIKRSNVIEVSFRSHDASFSQSFLGQLINEYLDLHALISHDPKAEAFFRAQSELLRKRLRSSEDALRGMQLQTGITDFDAQKQALITQLYNLQAEEHKSAADLAAAQQQVASLQKQLATTPKRLTKESKVVQNMALQALKPQVLALKAERAELLTRYTPTSERIREIDAKLAAAQKVLNRENHTEVQETTSDLNPVWVTIDTNLEVARSQAASLQATEQELVKQLSDSHNQIKSMTTNGLAVTRMQRQVDADKEAYLSYLRKGEEARAAEALNQSKILNVSVVQPPSRPLNPVFPNLPLNLMAGLLLAMAIGVAAAYWEEGYDQQLYAAGKVAELSGLPVVASVNDRY